MTATEQSALEAMRNAAANGWTTEALMVDSAALVLIRQGMSEQDAQTIAQGVFDDHFKIWGAV